MSRVADADDRRSSRLAATDEGRRILLEGRERRIVALAALLESARHERKALATAAEIIERRLLADR